MLYEAMGDHAAALPLLAGPPEITRTALGEDHPDYADSLNNLAGLYQAMGDHAAALPLYRQALEIRRTALGENHPDYAKSLNNLAELYRVMGDHAAALPLSPPGRWRSTAPRWARTTRTMPASLTQPGGGCTKRWATMPPPCPSTARPWRSTAPRWARTTRTLPRSLNCLAMLYQAMGDHAAALPLYPPVAGDPPHRAGREPPGLRQGPEQPSVCMSKPRAGPRRQCP